MVVAALLLTLSTACGTARVVRLDTGQGAPLEHRPPASSTPVRVEAEAFEEALARLVLNVPLALRPPGQGWLVLASHHGPGAEARWRQLMAQGYGGLCKAGERAATCVSLLDDVLGWSEWGKLGVALALSFEPMKASISRAVEKTLAPQLFYGVISTALVTWLVLAANPEPVFTKSAAIVSVLMLAYLGIETFLELVQASRELKRATDRATTLEALELAARRFADRVGPEIARVFVLAVTLAAGPGMVGGTALLASRLAMLPRFAQAAAVGASGVGINLVNMGQVSAVVVSGSAVVISLPTTAVAMTSIDDAARATRPASETWGDAKTLERHFRDHGTDFGAKTAEEYAEGASRFFQRSQAESLPTKIDADGVIRVYDPASNTFGAYNPNGTTRTFFKPTSPTYWERQPGTNLWLPGGN
jgi:hypothetical protein